MTNQQQEWEKEFEEQFEDWIHELYSPERGGGKYLYPELKSFIRTNFIPKSEIEKIVPEKHEAIELLGDSYDACEDVWNACRNEVITRLKKLGIEI